jgi:hypothetical protein
MSNYSDKKDAINIAPTQSHVHREVAVMHDKALVTREPYGKPGTFNSRYYPGQETHET